MADDKATTEFLSKLDEWQPTIPDDVLRYYLERSGFSTSDPQMQRLIALATQKFLSDVANDAAQHAKLRASKERKRGAGQELVLTVQDLSAALLEYGVTVKKPEYHCDGAL